MSATQSSHMHPYFSLKIKHLKLAYHYLISNSIYLFLIILFTILTKQDLIHLHKLPMIKLKPNLIPIVTISSLPLLLLLIAYLMNCPRKVYLVDFACFKPHPSLKTSQATCVDWVTSCGAFSKENAEFQRKITERSGIGEESYVPAAMLMFPPRHTINDARYDADMLMFGAIDEVLGKTGVSPKDIGILVVNCSLFTPNPSLASMVVHRYKLRGDIRSYNLGGMGCSAGLISIDLAQRLLQVHPNSYAMIVSTEIVTQNMYYGNDRSMLITNSLFKLGAAAILLSNKHCDYYRSKYRLAHVVRTHKGAQDNNYNCIYQREDESQYRGVSLSKDLMKVAGEALKTNITTLGPLVLPMSEKLLFLATLVVKKMFRLKALRPYIPDFKLAFEHFCIHAGGKAMLDAIEKSLELSESHIEPSKMTLYRFGNTSSSSVWYELAYMEAKRRINKGDRIWQIGFGSGFKCNSVVWHALRTINSTDEKNPWIDEIGKFPIRP